jgi:fructan beta-fructosidase
MDKRERVWKEFGAHGGVWECPDLFALDDNENKKVWVLIVSVNPGAPNGGSAAQYFTGDFDGNKFTPSAAATKWIDYGTDNYAGITWSNTGNRHIFLGWMSNWLYANTVPTGVWRNAMTIPRELKLKHVGNDIFVTSQPIAELNKVETNPVILKDLRGKSLDLSAKMGKIKLPCRLSLDFENKADFSLALSNDKEEKLVIGYDKNQNQYFIDRSKSGKVDFQKDFPGRHIAPRLSAVGKINISLIIDVSSVELFVDDGLTVMTEIFFPAEPYNQIHIHSGENEMIKKIDYSNFKSIWHN